MQSELGDKNKVDNHTLYTRCPTCSTAFKVTDELLKAAGGKVRCGACLAIFQATDYMLEKSGGKQNASKIENAKSDSISATTKLPQGLSEQQSQTVDDTSPIQTSDQNPISETEATEEIESEFLKKDIETQNDVNDPVESESNMHFDSEDESNEELTSEDWEVPSEPVSPAETVEESTEEGVDLTSATEELADLDPQNEEFDFEEDGSEFNQAIVPERELEESIESGLEFADNDENEIDSLIQEEPLDEQLASENTTSEDDGIDSVILEDDPKFDVEEAFQAEDFEGEQQTEIEQEREFEEQIDFDEPMGFEEEIVEQETGSEEEFEVEQEPDSELDFGIDEFDVEENFEDPEMAQELSEQLSEQMQETDSEPDPLDEFNKIVEENQTGVKSKIVMLVVLIGLVIGLQQIWSNRQQLAWSESWGGMMTSVCSYLPCDLKPRRDVSKIKLLQRQLSPDEEKENWLDVKVLLINEATFEQPYPTIKLAFSDKNGKRVDIKSFPPESYLDESAKGSMMPFDSEVHIHFKTEVSRPDALGFEFIFE